MNRFDKLTKYKQLLDQGVLTQEEFDDIKKRLFAMNVVHEHLDTGARVASESLGSIKKKTEGVYRDLKDRGNRWVDKELERDQINEAHRRLRREQKKRKRQEDLDRRKEGFKSLLAAIGTFLKKLFFCMGLLFLVLAAIGAAFYLSREKATFIADQTETLHGLEYSISDRFEKTNSTDKINDGIDFSPEKNEYKIYDKTKGLIASYTVEYLGEDVDTEIIKDKACQTLKREKVTLSGDNVDIEGYYKKDKIAISDIFGDSIKKERLLICTCDYSNFLITYKCNILNFDPESCDKLFDSIKLAQYKNESVASSLQVQYTGSYNKGYKPVKDDFNVEVNYENGKRSRAESFSVQAPEQLLEKDNTVLVECHGIKKIIHIRMKKDAKNEEKAEKNQLKEQDDFLFGNGQQA